MNKNMGYTHGTKWNYKLVSEFVKNLGYNLISKEYINMDSKLIIKDKDGYIYSISFYNLKSLCVPDKFQKSNPYTIQNIKHWCKLNNKPFELISDIYNGSKINLKWQCLKENCKEIFESTWDKIFRNCGCPFCAGKQVGLSNCLTTKNPELASEWHPTKNGDLTPYDVTCSSHKNIWWQCSKNPNHIWQATINARTKNECPHCSGYLPSKDYNLLTDNPLLCEEWDYKKNNKRPEEYSPHAHKEVWWKCKKCGREWKASINSRNRKYITMGCINCSEYKGEVKVREYLVLNKVYFVSQQTFINLIGLGGGLLSYDFYIPKYNLLIEYQGIQHEKPIDFGGKGKKYAEKQFKIQQEHDKRKKKYTLENKYNFLVIWYYDFDKIDNILNNYFNKLNNELYEEVN